MHSYLKPLRDNRFLQALVIVFLCLLIYIPSLKNGFIWDDDRYLTNNPWVQNTDGLKAIWFSHAMPFSQYYPMVLTSFWMEHKLWGLKPFGYHAVNLVLHMANALLLFWIVLKMYPRLAFICALLFAVHPIQVETVAWITERKNLLSMFFFLWTLLAYLRFDRTRSIKYYWLAVGLFVCALMSKSIAVCFVFVPVLVKWWQDGRVGWRQIRLSLVFVILGLLAAFQTAFLEFYHAGAHGREFDLTFLQRLVLSGRILWFYFYKIVYPVKFMFFYPRWTVDAGIWWQWLFTPAVALVFAALAFCRKKIGRGAPALFAFGLVSVFPALGFVNVYPMRFSFVADHFSYLSTPALLLLICAVAVYFFDALRKKYPRLRSAPGQVLTWGLMIMAILAVCGQSMALTRNYKDEETLWNQLIRMNPSAWIAYNNLGCFRLDHDKIEEAMPFFQKALQINPEYPEAYNNRGLVFYNRGNLDQAISDFSRAIELNPHYDDPHFNRGCAYYRRGEYDKALSDYDRVIQINPNYAEAYYNRAVIYFERRRYAESLEDMRKAQRLGYNVRPEVMEQIRRLGLSA